MISGTGGRAPPRRSRCRAKDGVGSTQLTVLPLELTQPSSITRARPQPGFALSYSLVSYFEFGIFKTIGVDNMADGVDRVLTALAVMGGAKGLHDLIGKVQKSKEASETGRPTG
jgi:hypothetical protein